MKTLALSGSNVISKKQVKTQHPGFKYSLSNAVDLFAGIRVKNYKTLWDGCKSDKARAAKLLELLQERGLKGKPTISECRRLKRKYEREQEFMELNTSNIIETEGILCSSCQFNCWFP